MQRLLALRPQIQDTLAGLAVLATLASTFFATLPSAAEYAVLLACAGFIAVCARFPILLRQTELTLAPAIAISLLFTFGVAPAAWMLLIGLLLGELWWFFAPGQAPTPERGIRRSQFAAQYVLQAVPLILAGGVDRWLANQFITAADARNPITLTLFGLIYVLCYNALLAFEVTEGRGAASRFFRENLGAVVVIELLPLPLVVVATLPTTAFGANLLLIIGAVLAVLALRLYDTSWTLLHQADRLEAERRAAETAQQRADALNRQLMVVSAKLELAQRDAQTLSRRSRHLETLTQFGGLLRSLSAPRPPYDALIRQIAEAVGSPIGQFGLMIPGTANLNFVATYGVSAERAALERNTVWLETHGITGRALRTGLPQRVANTSTDPDYLETFPGIRSELCVPLLAGERRLGLIRLLSRQAEAFGPEDEAFVTQAAQQIALALENARLLAENETRQKEHAILVDTGAKLAATLDIRTVYRAIVQKIAEALGADSAILAEVEPATGLLRMAEPRSPKVFPGAEYPAMARAAAERKPILLDGADETLTASEREMLQAENAAAAAVVPMINAHQVTGIVQLFFQEPRALSPSDQHIAQVLANQSAVALQNARLFHNVTEGRDRLAAILDSTREGVLVVDASGLVSLVNPPLVEFWGIPSHRLLNQHLLTLLDQPELDLAAKLGSRRDEIEELLLTLRAGLALSISKVQYAIYTPRLRYLERTGAPVLDQFAKAIGWVLILRDVTEERELQIMRDTLANMIVHDLRSPLTSVLAGVSLIRDRLPQEQQTPLIKQSLDVAIRSSNKMLDLVNTLLDLSRMESGELVLKRAPLDLNHLVNEVLSDLTPLANDQGVLLINDVQAGLPALPADREKLSRVLTNLLDNALKFSPPGGQVSVRASLIRADDNRTVVQCTVLDTGPGIPEEYLSRIFDRFVQVEGRKGRRQGTGLGLAFCKMAIEAHGGRLWAANRPEGGSAFSFILPVEV